MSRLFNRQDLDFLLYDVFDLEGSCRFERYGHHDRATFDQTLDLAEQLAEEVLWPHAALLDREEPRVENGRVVMDGAVGEALEKLKEAGFFSAHLSEELGGPQLPYILVQACHALFKGANVSTGGYMMLTKAAANLLAVHGSDEQKRLYMAPMNEGRFFGTMCLSEPDVGSGLGDVRCRAERTDELSEGGSPLYSIKGPKMWVSGGDHELSDNIVHLVLARLPGAPKGVKGLSLFAVPKTWVAGDGSLGQDNGVALAGLNHKMGFRGITNCLLHFGETKTCRGTLVGEEDGGLAAMFHMMNEARIGVGLGAVALGTVAYRLSVAYAKERKQGRTLSREAGVKRSLQDEAVPIMAHGDVRRMLLRQKALVEGGLALGLYGGHLLDQEAASPDPEARHEATLLLSLLTPVMKAWPSTYCLEANSLAIQIHGGYGYTRDFPVERLYRDNRLNAIHEGTDGIQALDLLGRKVPGEGGAAFNLFCEKVSETLAQSRDGPLASELPRLEALLKAVRQASMVTAERAQSDLGGALLQASPFLCAFGHLVVSWLWLVQVKNITDKLENNSLENLRAFYLGKIHAARYFFYYEVPLAQTSLASVIEGAQDPLNIPDAGF